jgi:tRNA pseudouridine32 synthase/23S rRNA pseudouridine746 synthase
LANLVYDTLQPSNIDLDQLVVHRLDMATSGIIVYALSLQALSKLHCDFKDRRVQKTYQALIEGHYHHHHHHHGLPHATTTEGEIDVDLERDPYNPPFMRIAQPKPKIEDHDDDDDDDGGGGGNNKVGEFGSNHKFWKQAPKPSLTTWTLLCGNEYYNDQPVSRVELRPWTGRTHQLRVHCAQALDAPIVGDEIYGPNKHDDTTPLCLHAQKLCIYHPISGAPMIFEADAPF